MIEESLTARDAEAVSKIGQLLDPDYRAPEEATDPRQEEADAEQAEALEEDGSEETPDEPDADHAEGEPDSEQESESEESDDTDDEQALLDKKVTVKNADGTSSKVAVKDLLRSGLREADYSRKTMALADERKALDSELAGVRAERAEYSKYLTTLKSNLESNFPVRPDINLVYSDPIAYQQREATYQHAVEQYQTAQREQERLNGEANKEQVQQLQRLKEEEFDKLFTKMPSWRDPKVYAKVVKDLTAYGLEEGWTINQLENTYDHKALLNLYKAMNSDKVAKAKPVAPDQVNKAKRIAPGSVNAAPRRSDSTTDAIKRHAKERSLSSAADAIGRLLG